MLASISQETSIVVEDGTTVDLLEEFAIPAGISKNSAAIWIKS